MAAAIAGEWELDKNENYDDFLKKVGMNAIKRGMVVKLGGSLSIQAVGDSKFKVKSVNGPKTKEREMPIGQDFDDEGPNGGATRGSWKVEGGKMVGRFKTEKGKEFVMSRHVEGDKLIQVMNFDGTEAKRFFKRKA